MYFRSGRTERRIIRTQSQSSDRSTPESSDFEPPMRKLSISKYDVLPPISNPTQKNPSEMSETVTSEKYQNIDVASYSSHEEEKKKIANISKNFPRERRDNANKTAERQTANGRPLSDLNTETREKSRALYRKGDIFKAPREQSEKSSNLTKEEDGTNIKNLIKKDKLFLIPCEPPSTDTDRLHLAFRHPEKERIQRYFSPTDRIGDVLEFLAGTLSEKVYISELGLHTNDFPSRKLENLDATLFDCGISDKMILNFMVYDDDQ